jgi:hypothetical protein
MEARRVANVSRRIDLVETTAERHPSKLYDWISIIDRCTFEGLGVAPKTIRAIAIRYALHANPDGSKCHPGPAKVSALTGFEYKTVKRVLAILDAYGFRTKTASGCGPRGERKVSANTYQLTIAEDLIDRLDVVSPAEIDLRAERIREANRRQPKSVTGNAATRKNGAAADPVGPVAGNAVPRNPELRGTSRPQYGEPRSAIPTHDLPPSDTYPPDDSPRADLTLPRARDREKEDQSIVSPPQPDKPPTGDRPTRPCPPGIGWCVECHAATGQAVLAADAVSGSHCATHLRARLPLKAA